MTKLSWLWLFGVAIFAVAQWRFFSFNLSFTKLVLQWQTAQAKTGNLKSTDVNPTLVRSERGPEGPLTDQGCRPL